MALSVKHFDAFYDRALSMPDCKTGFGSNGTMYIFGDIAIEVEVVLLNESGGYNIFRSKGWTVVVARADFYRCQDNWFNSIEEIDGDPEDIEADLIAARLWMD